jgi:cysteine desulfurase
MSVHYFDHAASAPRRDEVFEAMAPYLRGIVGNPSGSHRAARDARRVIEDAREEIADFCSIAPGGVIFTAGGTESCHLAISGVAHHFRRTHSSSDIVTSPVEHHAVLEAAEQVAADFSDVRWRVSQVDSDGVIDLDSLAEELSEHTAIVSVMAANNETGVIQPIDAVVQLVREHGRNAVVHCDAVAVAPWLELSTITQSVDLFSICAHKLGGPVNAGALLVRGDVGIDPVVSGGGQERGRRGGTVDVAAAVGLAVAVRASQRERASAVASTTGLANDLRGFFAGFSGVTVTASGARILPGHVHIMVDNVASDELLFVLDQFEICASAASSCSSGAGVASHVLHAMGVDPSRAKGAIRFTLGAETTESDVAALREAFTRAITQLRGH